MLKMISSAAAVLALIPVLWVSSAAWATALSAGLVADEVRRRLRSDKLRCRHAPQGPAQAGSPPGAGAAPHRS